MILSESKFKSENCVTHTLSSHNSNWSSSSLHLQKTASTSFLPRLYTAAIMSALAWNKIFLLSKEYKFQVPLPYDTKQLSFDPFLSLYPHSNLSLKENLTLLFLKASCFILQSGLDKCSLSFLIWSLIGLGILPSVLGFLVEHVAYYTVSSLKQGLNLAYLCISNSFQGNMLLLYAFYLNWTK